MSQYGRPDSDLSVGSWTATPLYQKIDEVSADDTDFVSSANNPSNDAFEVTLSSLAEPGPGAHTIRSRFRKSEDAGTVRLTISLKEGGVTRTSSTYTTTALEWQQATYGLTQAQIDSISNYQDLTLHFNANQTVPGGTPHVDVSWTEFEIPDSVPPVGRSPLALGPSVIIAPPRVIGY